MATYTVTTPVNIDTLTAKVGSDTYNINGGYLTVDSHTRYGVNQNTSAWLGNITLSATLGGTVEFNSTKVRLIAYTAWSGTVPALDTAITIGWASGKLLGVYSALNVAPTAAAAAMPATWFILVRQWNSVEYSAWALTGITATSSWVSRPWFLEIVWVDALTCKVNRLNLFKVRGDYFDFLGVTTSGSNATTYQAPTNGSIFYAPYVEVETGTWTWVYEQYPCAWSLAALAANIGTDTVRGKVCWISTAGLIRFGSDGTNSTGWYVPPSWRKIRIPNIFFMCCTAAALTANVLPNATLATRYDFTTTGGWVIDIENASMCWYPSFAQPYSVRLVNTGILTQLSVSEIASPIVWSNVCVWQEAANTQVWLLMSLCFAWGTMSSCTWTRSALATAVFVVQMTDCSWFTITNEWSFSFVKAANAGAAVHGHTRVSNTNYTGTKIGWARIFPTTCTDLNYTTTTYYDHPGNTTPTTIPMYFADLWAACIRCKFDGIDFWWLTLVQPYSGILNIWWAWCANIKLRNLGTYASPLDMWWAQQNWVAWSRTTTVATVTKTAHGLKVNDIVYCIISSNTAAIVVWSKTVASVPTADTFTFTCLNAGWASGTLSYYPTMAAFLVVLGGWVAANTVNVQRCYTPHLRTGLYSIDNSSKNFLLESVFGDYISNSGMTGLNAYHKSIASTQLLTASTAIYGSHWFDMFTNEVSPNLSAQAWARTTTVATVTSTDHGLRTGLQVVVNVTSDASAIVLWLKTVTVLTKDTFTFTCLNAGWASGTLTYEPINGRIGMMMNESTSDTTNQYTIDSWTPQFTSAWSLYAPTVNQQITFETPYYILWHERFPITQPIMAGGTIGNYDITYAIDTGSGYSAFKNLSYPRAWWWWASASTNVTMTDTTGVAVGDYVFGTNIAPNAKVSSITNGTTVVVDIANIGVVSWVLTFNKIPSESNIPSTWAKLKVRFKTTTTNATAITSFYIPTKSTSTTRAYQYPLDTNTITLTGLKTWTEVRAYLNSAGDNGVEVWGTESSGTSFAFNVEWWSVINIMINHLNYLPADIWQYTVSWNASIPISQFIDRNYLNP